MTAEPTTVPVTEPATRAGQKLAWKFAEAERLARLSPAAREVYCRLSVLRARLARDVGVPAFHVLTNRLVLELAEARPQDGAALAGIAGFGPRRLRAYGAEVLQILRGYQGGPAA